MLFSRMVVFRTLKALEKARNSVIDSTAIGTDADTVSPTFSTRYSDDAPKMKPSTAPTSLAGQVNSGGDSVGGTNGSCGAGSGEPEASAAGVFGSDMERLGWRCGREQRSRGLLAVGSLHP